MPLHTNQIGKKMEKFSNTTCWWDVEQPEGLILNVSVNHYNYFGEQPSTSSKIEYTHTLWPNNSQYIL